MTGGAIGTITFILTALEEEGVKFRKDTMQNLINHEDDRAIASYCFFAIFAVICVALASALTVYVGPGANGSGTPEIMGLLNGVNYPKTIGFWTLLIKCLGTSLAVVGGLCIGKEGPLAHIGAIVGVMTIFLPFKCFDVL